PRLTPGMLPSMWLLVIGPARFLNETLATQTNRRRLTFHDTVIGKIRTVARVLVEPHFLFLAAIAALLIVVCIRRRQPLPLSVAVAATLAITNLVPTPSYDQYFVTLIPFLAIAAIELIGVL